MNNKEAEAIVNIMRGKCPNWLNKYEDFLDDLLKRKKISWEVSEALWDSALAIWRKEG